MIFGKQTITIPKTISRQRNNAAFLSLGTVAKNTSLAVKTREKSISSTIAANPQSVAFFIFKTRPFEFNYPIVA